MSPTLALLTVLWLAGFVTWLLDVGRWPTAVALPGAVVAGLGAGIVLGAWTA